jgi:hypothetical protein
MKKVLAVGIGVLVVVGFAALADTMGWLAGPGITARVSAAAPQAPGRAGARGNAAQPPTEPPAFDGDVASLVWGGRLESLTGETSVDAARGILTPDWNFRTKDSPGPVDVVISFFKRDSVLVGAVTISSLSGPSNMKEVEVWASPAGATEGFTKLGAGTMALEPSAFKNPEITITFAPVEARFVKVRLVSNYQGNHLFRIKQVRVFEAKAAGYVPLLKRRPEIASPEFLAEGAAAAAAQAPPVAGCAPAANPPMQAGNGESGKVMLLKTSYLDAGPSFQPLGLKSGRFDKARMLKSDELRIFERVETTLVATNHVEPWMLADVDTVVMQQACDLKPLSPRMRKALVAWVAAGHKLIVHDADKCGASPDYSWLPYRFKSDNPGALGQKGSVLKVVENNWMMHDLRGRPGFVDAADWVTLGPPANELGDSNAVMDWDPGWCGQMVVRNANGIFGFVQAYAHYGRGLILWDGLDVDMMGTGHLDLVHARQLAQGFNTDNLPCSLKIGSFIVTTEPRLLSRGVQAGQAYTYPLSVLSNLGYKGTVSLSAAPKPAMAGLQARVEPATVELTSQADSALTLTLPPGGAVTPFAVEVKGTAADGKTNSLCLQLGPQRGGGLAVVSTLAPPTRTRRNLEIILDASGSMKTLMGAKTTRWDVALDTLELVLAQLPDDFNVGLRIYGHRELSTSPTTCTDSELVIPVRKLDRKAILARARSFRPKGETPLVYSALQAPSDLKSVGGGTVILITDGEESCKGDPVKAAAELKASGLDIRLNIVGFALKDPKTQKDLAGFSQATGGLFYAAESGAALSGALMLAAIEKFPYAVFDASGKQVLASEAGSGVDELPPGDYKVVVKAGSREIVAPKVKIALGSTTTLRISFKQNQLVLE